MTAAEMSVRLYTCDYIPVSYLLSLSIQLDCNEVVEFFGELAVIDLYLETLLDAFHNLS